MDIGISIYIIWNEEVGLKMSDKLTGCFVNEPVLLDKPAPDFSAEAYYRGERIKI
jgi:hypothetical protein